MTNISMKAILNLIPNLKEKPKTDGVHMEEKDWFEEELERRIKWVQDSSSQEIPRMGLKDYRMVGIALVVCLAALIAGAWIC